MASLTIITEVAGSFTVDATGIRSDEPVAMELDNWDSENRLLTLKGVPCNMGGMSIVTSGGNCIVGNCSRVIIGGRVVSSGSSYGAPTKMYSRSWLELGLKDPKLSGIQLTGSGDYKILMDLDDDCDFTCTGSGSIKINGNHNTNLFVSVTGSGSIKGHGVFNKINANVTGSGSVKGFQATKRATAKLTGSGKVRLVALAGCAKSKTVMGSGKVVIE